jgi:hypothetical protein
MPCLLLAIPPATAGGDHATERPILVDRLPGHVGLPLAGGGFAFLESRRGESGVALFQPARLGEGALRQGRPSGFSDLLIERMRMEAVRLEMRDSDDLGRVDPAWAGFEDSHQERVRAQSAERIVTRAFDKAVDLKLENLARTTGGLREAWDWVEQLGERTRSASIAATPAGPFDEASRRPAPRMSARVGFKIDAHPKLTLGAELFGIRGRIEIPVLDEPTRITLERQLGSRAQLRLSGGVWRGEDDWVNLSFRLGF